MHRCIRRRHDAHVHNKHIGTCIHAHAHMHETAHTYIHRGMDARTHTYIQTHSEMHTPYTHAHKHAYIQTHTNTQACTHTNTYKHTCIHTYTHPQARMYTCIHAHTSMHPRTHTSTRTRMHTYGQTCTRMHAYMHTHANRHTYIQLYNTHTYAHTHTSMHTCNLSSIPFMHAHIMQAWFAAGVGCGLGRDTHRSRVFIRLRTRIGEGMYVFMYAPPISKQHRSCVAAMIREWGPIIYHDLRNYLIFLSLAPSERKNKFRISRRRIHELCIPRINIYK
jgi:hypothetical protein